MGTAVSGSTLNLSASSTAASPDTGRNATNGVLGLSFSDLLRGQIQSGAETRTPEPLQQADARPAPAPTRTPPPSTTETPRPSQPTRDPARTTCQNSPPETGQSVKQQAETQETSPPPQQASTGTDKTTESSEEETTSGNTTPNQRPIQPQLADATISPELPATIAALLIGIAGEIAEDDAVAPETLTQGTPRNEHTGHFRQPETSGNLPARTATSMQAGVDMENDVGDDGNGTNTPALLTGRASKENLALTAQGQSAASASGTGKEAARVNATAPDVLINAASMASMASRESSDARTVPAGVTANGGDIPMLNPPRLPTQVGAALPQFTIPSGAGQRPGPRKSATVSCGCWAVLRAVQNLSLLPPSSVRLKFRSISMATKVRLSFWHLPNLHARRSNRPCHACANCLPKRESASEKPV